MPRSKYKTTVKKREACAREKGLTGCHKCKHNIWTAQPCELSYELASHDIENVECRIAEIHNHHDAVQYLESTNDRESKEELEAELKKFYGYDITLEEFIEHARAYVNRLKERVATRDTSGADAVDR